MFDLENSEPETASGAKLRELQLRLWGWQDQRTGCRGNGDDA
jgi:hypothetical protein